MEFYDVVVVDEVHHGPATSYRVIFDKFRPRILLGLTATPERMDGESVAADFGNRFAAEIRLPEALEEKLLCPFHYFGVADPVSLSGEQFWRGGKYDVTALENVYTGAHALALERLNVIVSSLQRYEPDLSRVRGIGFCVSIRHAEFMAERFNECGITSAVVVGETEHDRRTGLLNDFRAGNLRFLFTRDVLNEGLDVPDVNTVLFLRPADESRVGITSVKVPFPCSLELHATYGSDEIKAALGGASFESAGVTGVGRLHFQNIKTFVSLVTFQKSEKEFSPSTMYQDYPISRDLLHWETQSQTSQASDTGQTLIHHSARGYTMLFFARARKKINGVTEPFTFLGPAQIVSYQSERPIRMVWRLDHPMPAEMFEDNRRGG